MTYELKEKLTVVFRELRKKGWFAKKNHTCCQSCGWYETSKEHTGKDYKNIVFYHRQDSARIDETSQVHLAWSGNPLELLTECIKQKLMIEWDGSENTRIMVTDGEDYGT
jgi:hypothetical protein